MSRSTKTLPLRFFQLLLILLMAPGAGAQDCDGITTFAEGLEPSLEIHVATHGDDDLGDGSSGDPYATIARAAQDVAPGAAVVVHAGQYAGGASLSGLRGLVDAPVWLGGAPGEERPVIVGGMDGLRITRPQYLVLHDLEIRDASMNGVNVDDGGDYDDPTAAHHILFDNLWIHDIGDTGNQDGLKLSGLNNFFVLDSEISNCGGSGIDHVGCHHGLVARCLLSTFGSNAVQCKGGSEDLEIRWCRISDPGERGVNVGGSTGWEYFRPPLSTVEPNVEARDIRVLANEFIGGTAPIAFVGSVECIAANNTLVDPERWVLRILQETVTYPPYEFLPCGDNDVINNLVCFTRADVGTCVNIGANTTPETFVFAHNLWYAHDDPAASTPVLPAPETGGVYGLDPLLADPVGGDFAIPEDSPADGAGEDTVLIDGDVTGTCYESPPSIGAHEVVGSSTAVDGPSVVLIQSTCRPNPFNPCTVIVFDLADSGPVHAAVYDARGRRTAVLLNETLPVGRHEVVWDGTDDTAHQLPSGTYFYVLETGGQRTQGTMTLIR